MMNGKEMNGIEMKCQEEKLREEKENSEEFMEDVCKKELGSDFETMDSGVAVGLIDFTQDSEYKRLYGNED